MILELKNIYKTYVTGDIDVPVLKDISFNMEQGDYVAIMGPSGSGKSTLMNIIGCLDKPTSGTYFLDGIDILSQNDNKLSKIRCEKIGFVFQTFELLAGETALYNVMLPLSYRGVKRSMRAEIAKDALNRVGLQDRINFYPRQLSGGQKQRVSIARALVNSPSVLLADEPTGALDQASGKSVMDLFDELNLQGVTVIVITHDPNVAKRAKRIINIVDGRITDSAEAGV